MNALLMDMIFPCGCVLCGRPFEGGGCGCRSCSDELDLLRSQPACPTCGASPGPHVSPDGRCRYCRSRKFCFDGTARVGPDTGGLKFILRQFKYHQARHLDRMMGDWMVRSLRQAPWCNQVEAFVAVPSHWVRRVWQDSGPVPILTRLAGRSHRRPLLPLVRRVRLDRHQIGLSTSARFDNVKGAFQINPHAQIDGASICVVDDVMTSGATLHEMAKVLKEAGASKVWNLVFSRAGQQDSVFV